VDVGRSELADRTVVEEDLVFRGQVEWDGAVADIEVLLTRAADVLIGTAFLKGHRVQLDISTNVVRVERIVV
jgi:hypothetical protein